MNESVACWPDIMGDVLNAANIFEALHVADRVANIEIAVGLRCFPKNHCVCLLQVCLSTIRLFEFSNLQTIFVAHEPRLALVLTASTLK